MNPTINPKQDLTKTLTGEMLFFGLMGKVLYTYPEREWLSSIAQEEVFAEIPIETSKQPDVQAGLDLLHQWEVEQKDGLSEDELDSLRGDYTRLFIGPGFVLAPPWESVYFNEERLIFQQQTLNVRSWYRKFGLQAENLYQEPDDHIGIELAFLTHLTHLCLQALENEQQAKLADLLKARSQFLQTHLLRWGSRFCNAVLKESKTSFYQGIALLLRGVLSELGSAYTRNRQKGQMRPFQAEEAVR